MIRERVAQAQAHCRACEEDWPVWHVRPILTDLAALLEECERLEAQAADLRAALAGLQTYATESTPCWCDDGWVVLDEGHAAYCLAARAALGEPE